MEKWTEKEKQALLLLASKNTTVYVNQEGHGVGILCMNGKRVKGLKDVIIEAHTDTWDIVSLSVLDCVFATEEII